MSNLFSDIKSHLDALKLKDFELEIYNKLGDDAYIIPNPIPFKGINIDMLYKKNNRILFIKFMDTTEDLFSFLDEEILEVMNEEHKLMASKMTKLYPEIFYNFVYVMPYIEEIVDTYSLGEFVDNSIICGNEAQELIGDLAKLDSLLGQENSDVALGIFLYNICSEYFVLTKGNSYNKHIKKITFSGLNLGYKMVMMDDKQIECVNSADYGNHVILGGAGTGKTSIMLARLIKLSKIYPHHKFLFLTFTKQQYNRCLELLSLMRVDMSNIELHTFSSFVFKVAKANDLVIDYNTLKKNYDKAFTNVMKQVQNSVKNKKMFKGIFVSEGENFNEDEILLMHEFLYSKKYIFNISICKAYNINNNLNIYKCRAKAIEYEDELELKNNYLQSNKIVDYINDYCDRSNKLLRKVRANIAIDMFKKTRAMYKSSESVNIVKIDDLDEQIKSVIWEINHLVNDKGYRPEDIAVVYPFNKKRLKNGKVIYFQYMLRKSLEEAGIAYTMADDTITLVSPKNGVTVSNIYSIKSLSYKAVIICELEMLYNHSISKDEQDYLVNDFAGDLNKVYVAMTRAEEYLCLIMSYTSESSDIIKLLTET